MTTRFGILAALVTLTSAASFGQVSFRGDLVIVQDPSGAINNLVSMNNQAILPSQQEQFCRAAFNAARAGGLADDFDGVVTFTAWEGISDLNNVWQGSPVRADGTGYGRQTAAWANTYNSSKIGQCVFMGTLGRTTSFLGGFGPESLPSDPEGEWSPSLGFAIPGVKSLTGIEMLGHEYGHHWLMGAEFDQNDSRGRQHFIRGFNQPSDPSQQGYPNQHYSHWADSRSVMYGSCITDKGGGTFELKGCARKYSHIDQYLMGLRASTEVDPMMVLENPADPGKGADVIAMSRTASGMTLTGYTRHDITADEIINAMGSRVPASPGAPRCWRVAFIVVAPPGQTTVPQAMLDKATRYLNRWGPWFNWATDGRGTMDTRITGNGCVTFNPDAGVVTPPIDAGMPEVDAGVVVADAGVVVEPDAGTPEEDAGVTAPPDAGTEEADAGQPPGKWDTYVPYETGKINPGCGCSAPSGGELFALLSVMAVWSRRRARR